MRVCLGAKDEGGASRSSQSPQRCEYCAFSAFLVRSFADDPRTLRSRRTPDLLSDIFETPIPGAAPLVVVVGGRCCSGTCFGGGGGSPRAGRTHSRRPWRFPPTMTQQQPPPYVFAPYPFATAPSPTTGGPSRSSRRRAAYQTFIYERVFALQPVNE